VVRGRIDSSTVLPEQDLYDVVTARALASPRQTLLWCAPCLQKGGMLVLFLGSDVEEGLASCKEALDQYSMAVEKTIPYLLPKKKARRNAVIIRKLTASECEPVPRTGSSLATAMTGDIMLLKRDGSGYFRKPSSG
jgi:16S rRNA G527 N7-methylase RsmG